MQFTFEHWAPQQCWNWLRENLPRMSWEEKRVNLQVGVMVHICRRGRPVSALGLKRYRALMKGILRV